MRRVILAALPASVREFALDILHHWQRFYDVSRTELREFSFKGKWREFRDVQKAMKRATMVVQDNQGIRFVLYPWDRPNLPQLVQRKHDSAEFQAISRLVRPGDVVFDIGANIGAYTAFLSRLCGSSGRVWAFEPVPDTYWRLQETVALNRCDNTVTVKSVVSEKSGTATMNLFDPQHSEWNSLGNPSMSARDGTTMRPNHSLEVPSLSLDDFCRKEGIGFINFIKVDVEGFELSVFKGATNLLEKGLVDHICFEISREPLRGAGVEGRAVFAELKSHGYLAYRFDANTKRFRGPIEDSAEMWMNYYASRHKLAELD